MMLSHQLWWAERSNGTEEGMLQARVYWCYVKSLLNNTLRVPHTVESFARVWNTRRNEAILGRKRGPGTFQEGFALDTWWGYSGKATRTKGKFTFYVLIPFMMIFSCVEYPILVVRGGWWCTVDCFSRLSEPFVFSLFEYHTCIGSWMILLLP